MGPIITLDKSAFQSLSRREHLFLHKHFTETLTPILAMELLADLSKQRGLPTSPDSWVAVLAEKFGGSGPVTNADYRTLCVCSLMGARFVMDGRIVPAKATVVGGPGRPRGLYIGLSPVNEAILRWSMGDFSELERQLAGLWRRATESISLESFRDQLNDHHVILPSVRGLEDLLPTTDALLSTATLQDVWLDWLIAQLAVPMEHERFIRLRWRIRGNVLLKDFAPYAWHCVRVLLTLVIATRFGIIHWQPTNLIDMQYLYYLPFCMVFASNDHLHRALVPPLLRIDQSFAVGERLKADLRRLADDWEGLNDEQRTERDFALGSYPSPSKDSIVHELWKRHCRPWRPGRGNRVTRLPQASQSEAIRQVRAMFQEVEGEEYFTAPEMPPWKR